MRIAPGLLLGTLLLGPVAATATERLPAVLHVHSTLSTGQLSLEDLAALAEQGGIGAIFLSENYLLHVEYGLPPFRALTRVSYNERSVLASGIDGYLRRVAEVRRRFPRVLVLPGVEVMPHYRWTGSPFRFDMTVSGTQKNVLVFGVSDPAVLRALPAIGNPHTARYTWQSVVDVSPAVLIVPGAMLLAVKRRRRERLGRAVVVVERRAWLTGTVLCAVGMIALVRAWPFTSEAYPPYGDLGLTAHQDLIDEVQRAGGVTVWSFPEAVDSGARKVGLVNVSWETTPYADDLLRTFRYTAFGAVYENATRFERPGDGWDRLLRQYAAGERRIPAWAVGESGFHEFSAGKRFGTLQTVFLVDERSEAAVLDAFRHGRMYALHRAPKEALALGAFAVRAGAATATSGDTLMAPPGTPLEVDVAIDASDGGPQEVRVALVRDGAVVEAWSGTTPFRGRHLATFDGRSTFFRVDARGVAPHRLLTNPIFVRP
ncbi:MAG TPA: hypothetical protein VGL09_15965 [Methylomirabilota bacterium]